MADVTSCEKRSIKWQSEMCFFLGGGGWGVGVGDVGVLCTTTTGGVFTSLRSEGTLPLALIPNSSGVH